MMGKLLRGALALGLALGLTAATGGDGTLDTPEWMTVDNAAKTVAIDLVVGMTPANNNWNYNGLTKGEATIVVPVGYTITLNFVNKDPAMAHSVGVSEKLTTWPPVFTEVAPAFAGAMSSNPTDMATSTMPGASETIRFVADTAGEYALVCYLPAHATTGMWLGFDVSADGSVGLAQ